MKKIVLSLSALVMCLMLTSCGNPTSKIESLTEKIENKGDSWDDPDKWEDVLRDFADAYCSFAESTPEEEEFEDFKNAVSDFHSACYSVSNKKAKRARDKAEKRFDKDKKFEKQMKAANKRLEKMEKKFRKKDRDDDEEETED